MNRARTLTALIVAVGIPSVAMIAYRMRQSSGFAPVELIVYPLLFGGLGIVALVLLKRFFLREPLRDFNDGEGGVVSDVLLGVGLAAGYFVLFVLERATLSNLLASTPNLELLDFMLEMREHTWMLLVWFGPVLWIGVALFEELVRAFVLTGLWSLSRRTGWTIAAIAIAAVLVGLTHWSQGPYGIVTIAIKGAVAGAVYYKRRRLLPLVLAHVLYDGIQVGLLLATYPR